MVANTDMRASPQAAEVVAKFRAQGYEPLGTTLFVSPRFWSGLRRSRPRAHWTWMR